MPAVATAISRSTPAGRRLLPPSSMRRRPLRGGAGAGGQQADRPRLGAVHHPPGRAADGRRRAGAQFARPRPSSTTVAAVLFIGVAQGPINPASAHILAQRVPREYFGMVFSVKQTGTPLGFALANDILFPACFSGSSGRATSLVAAGITAGRAIWSSCAASSARRRHHRSRASRRATASGARSAPVLRHPAAARAGLLGLRLRHRPTHFRLPTSSPISASIAASASPALGFLLFLSPNRPARSVRAC